ncbi:AraC family transcriptional regulator [Methyloceanibacter stevinii]|nr:AraC family transcriptional regulator [Methyloceanibacter stevinii]
MANPTNPAMQRAASLMQLPALLSELGVPLDVVLAGTGVLSDELRPDTFIPYAAYLAILDNAAANTGREDIGLLLGNRQSIAALGPLGRVMCHAATLGEALSEFAAFQIGNSTGATVYLMQADRDVVLGYGIYDPAVHASVHVHDVVVAVGCKLVKELTLGSVVPEEVWLARPAPQDLKPYRSLGGMTVRFGQSHSGVVVGSAGLACRLPQGNATLHEAALTELAPDLAKARKSVAGLVRHELRHLLLTSRARMDDAAAHLGVHPRSLRRRLQEEGVTFEELKDEVRYAMARDLLRLGALSVTDIATTLDYSSASSFVHAFGRWSGISPAKWRKKTNSPASAPSN